MKAFKFIAIIVIIASATISCSPERAALVQSKPGVQLWGENCMRCHNAPSPAAFNDADWTAIQLHMQVRANLTVKESKKVFDFLRSAN